MSDDPTPFDATLAAQTGAGPAPKPQSDAVPQTIGRFRIVERVGMGGMGVVYRARDPQLNRDVAIKLLRGGHDDPQLQSRLLREAQAMAALSHPNLITVYDVGTHDGRVYIAMEYVAGHTLRDWLRSGRSWREALTTFIAAGRGLQHAHDEQVVHRDFKPDNVLVSHGGRVQVLDFGLAHGVVVPTTADGGRPGDDELHRLTQTGAILGTPAYMSPEQHAAEPTDARTDQFSFAVAVYEALYGTRPFPGATIGELAHAMATSEAAVPVPSEVPAAVTQVLLRALRRDPAERHASMSQMLGALDVAARPPASRRRAALVVGGGVIVTAAVAAGVWYGTRNQSAGQRSTSGHLPASAIAAVVQANTADIRECYERHNDGRAGTVNVDFFILPDGTVDRVELRRNDLQGTQVGQCVAARALMWTFPRPDPPGDVRVAYPFVFAPPAEP